MNKTTFEKQSDKEFTVLNLTDPQLGNNDWEEGSQSRRLLEYTVSELVKRTKPDLITVTGDLACAGEDHAYDMLANFLDSFRIPWSPVWGNHDNQWGDEQIRSVIARYKEHPFFVYEDGPSELGNGNYVIKITEKEKPVCALIMLDTHDRAPYTNENGEEALAWGKLQPNQIEWAKERINELKKEGCPDAVVFQHIPIYGYRLASKAAFKDGIDQAAMTFAASMGTECWNSGYEESIGVQHEEICSYPADEGALSMLKRTGLVSHIVAGHDHTNNWMIKYEGIKMIYSLKAGAGCYWEPESNGGTVLKIGDNGVSRVYHEYVDPNGVTE